MKTSALTLITIVGVVTLLMGSVTVAGAADKVEQSAEQSQTLKIKCTSGAYGQDSSCKAEGSQSQKLHQVISYSKVLGSQKVHTPVNTAVDPALMLVVFATGLTGVGAFIGYARLSR